MPPRRSDDDRRLPENRAVDVHFAAGRPAARTSPSANNASEPHPKNHAQKTLTLNTLITLTPTFIFNTEKKIFLKIYIAPLL